MNLKNLFSAHANKTTKDEKETKPSENLEAGIVVSALSYNTSVVIMDENGEWRTPPVPDPVQEEFTVKKGDHVKGFELAELTRNFLVLKSSLEYLEGKETTPKTQFIVEKGERIDLNVYGLCDAVQKISIEYIGVVE